MFSIVFLCAIFTFVSAAPIEQEFIVVSAKFIESVQHHIDKCEKETNPPPKTLEKMLRGNIENDASLNFAYCYLLNAGFMEKDGHVNADTVISVIQKDVNKDNIRKAFEECNKTSGKDNLDTLRLMLACYKENSPIIFTL